MKIACSCHGFSSVHSTRTFYREDTYSGVARFKVVVRPIFGRSMRTRGGCGASPLLSLPFARSTKFCNSRHIMVPSEAFSLQFLGVYSMRTRQRGGCGVSPPLSLPLARSAKFCDSRHIMVPLRSFLFIFSSGYYYAFWILVVLRIKYKSLHATFQESAMVNQKDEGSLVPSPTP